MAEQPYQPSDAYRGPSCMRCQRPTTWREGQGFLHSKDPSGPLVYYPHEDPFGHAAVSCWEWCAPHERHALTTSVDCPGKYPSCPDCARPMVKSAYEWRCPEHG